MLLQEQPPQEETKSISVGNIIICVIITGSIAGMIYVLIRKYRKERK